MIPSYQPNLEQTMKYTEGQDSTVSHNGKEYRVDDLLKICKSKPTTDLPVKDLKWILQYTTVEPSRVDSADITVPIIVLKEKSRFVVLDGAHRLTKAVKEGVLSLPCLVMNPAELPKPVTDKPSSKQW